MAGREIDFHMPPLPLSSNVYLDTHFAHLLSAQLIFTIFYLHLLSDIFCLTHQNPAYGLGQLFSFISPYTYKK